MINSIIVIVYLRLADNAGNFMSIKTKLALIIIFITVALFSGCVERDIGIDVGNATVLETTSQMITAAQGGTITLPSGSSVSIPAGTLTTDQTVSLYLISSLPKQPPSGFIISVGPALVLSFSQAQVIQNNISKPSEDIRFVLNLGSISPTGIGGSAPIADIVDLDGEDNFVGIIGEYNADTNIATMTVPSSFLQNAQRVMVSMANLRTAVESAPLPEKIQSTEASAVNLRSRAELALLTKNAQNIKINMVNPEPAELVPLVGGKVWNGDAWVDGSFDTSKKTLVLVHGMLSDIKTAFGGCENKIMKEGGYEQVVGFDYDWTQGIDQSGQQLAGFLNHLKQGKLKQVDIQAHSEGVPVSLYAAAKADIPIGNMTLLGGPIMGTPAATVGGPIISGGLLHIMVNPFLTVLLNQPVPKLKGTGKLTLQDLFSGQFANDLQPGSKVLENIRKDVRDKMVQKGSNLEKTRLIAVAGTDSGKLGRFLGHLFNEPFDGIIGESSALAEGSGFDDDPERLYRLAYPLKHSQLECDPDVIKDVGSLIVGRKLTLTLKPGPFTCTVGIACTVQLVDKVMWGLPNYYYQLHSLDVGNQPDGMYVNNGNGSLIGTPTKTGVYNFRICVVDTSGATSCKATSVTVVAQAKPIISLSTNELLFSSSEGTNPLPQSFSIKNTGSSRSYLNYTITDETGGRVTLSPRTGTLAYLESSTISVSIDTRGLSAAGYKGTITVSDPDATNSPQNVVVKLIVYLPTTPTPTPAAKMPTLIVQEPDNLPAGTLGRYYEYTFSVSGGTPPYSIDWIVGLPFGLKEEGITIKGVINPDYNAPSNYGPMQLCVRDAVGERYCISTNLPIRAP